MRRIVITLAILGAGAIYLARTPNQTSTLKWESVDLEGRTQSTQKEAPHSDTSAESLLVYAAYLTLLVLIYQANEMRKATEAMRASTRVMSDTAKKELRAYLCVSSVRVKFYSPVLPEALVHVKNCGKTPAYKVGYEIHLWIGPYPLPPGTALPPLSEIVKNATAAIGADGGMTITHPKNSTVAIPQLPLGTPASAIYIYGVITYEDAFGEKRYTRFRCVWGSPSARKIIENGEERGVPIIEIEGNEAN